jgi:hypothetical protein
VRGRATASRERHGQKLDLCSRNGGKPFKVKPPPMGSSPSQQKIYREAVAGIPRVVRAISELPSRQHADALAAAGRGYRATILESGIAEQTADRMVATLLRRLQNRLAKERSVKDKVMRALHAELIPGDVEKRPPKRRRRAAKRPPHTEAPPVQDELDAELTALQKSPTTSPE